MLRSFQNLFYIKVLILMDTMFKRTDHLRSGGGVAKIENQFCVKVLLFKSVSRQFDSVVLDLEVSPSLHMTDLGR